MDIIAFKKTILALNVISKNNKKIYYQALLDKNSEFEGTFFVGVKTTGVFCRPTCPARKPKFINCEFFKSAKEAMLASYRACQRCQPLSHPNQVSPAIKKLVEAVEADPEKRWKDKDFAKLSIDASTARRQFKKRFGMTFVEYARARRMGLAMKHIRKGNLVIDAQLSSGYESGSGFRDAFSKIMGAAPTKSDCRILNATWLDTELGPMVSITDNQGLYLLEFVDRRGLELEVERLRKRLSAAIIPGETHITKQLKIELEQYFQGENIIFKTPINLVGTPFQKQVWKTLQDIPTGETLSYADLAKCINKPTACRAVAQANGANQISIIIPCHRVINSNGDLGGYGGGIIRKQWLINHEKNITLSK
ncbi:bifunctional transcriptional activator/DNA repair protein Ada [Francisella sp. Scap27]|uniref:bifunctional transcriptional activator/DNA repair enzyme AdaA n=1 Tax=Francisella sp. Scap27 TaxID=2589986 RepID=UPI0015B972AF|nr:trifunctional transcriptional activator/DNA repair protein Ada/methylated-DNA--[protein]-cysteine S-methyltransferase [Francisella sp. Scap27]QLE79758.1 bifunctional transcriptional activator/DNA repair protein Ada [Francisella sp. Scap27]